MKIPAPMLAAAQDTLPAASALPGGTAYEPKFDGFRALAVVDSGRVVLYSRRGKDLSAAFPDVVARLAEQLTPPLVLDGELVVWSDSRLDFQGLQDRLVAGRSRITDLASEHPATFVAFDMLEANGRDLRPEPYRARQEVLEAVMRGCRPPIELAPVTFDRDEALLWWDTLPSLGVEGLVCKGADQPYMPGQRGWVKVRYRATTEALVGAVTGELAHPDRVVLGAYTREGSLRVVGMSVALPRGLSSQLGGRLLAAGGAHPWPEILPSHLAGGLRGQREPLPILRVEPTIVVEVSADVAFENGRWRHPVRVLRVRDDIEPHRVAVANR